MKTFAKICLLFALCLSASGCMSVPKSMPEDATSAELIQRAQEFLDKKNYKAADFVYKTLLERYGSDIEISVSAKFEIAHIFVKQKKWREAYPLLNELNELYLAGEVPSLPPEYGKLVQYDLDKIPEKIKLEAAGIPAEQAGPEEDAAVPADGPTAETPVS